MVVFDALTAIRTLLHVGSVLALYIFSRVSINRTMLL